MLHICILHGNITKKITTQTICAMIDAISRRNEKWLDYIGTFAKRSISVSLDIAELIEISADNKLDVVALFISRFQRNREDIKERQTDHGDLINEVPRRLLIKPRASEGFTLPEILL